MVRRHLIHWLVRKPGAFENYRYRAALFSSSRFRMAYDALRHQHPPRQADREYLAILRLAAHHSERPVEQALETLLSRPTRLPATRSKPTLGRPQRRKASKKSPLRRSI